jgi:hypothetical protein
MDLIRTCEVGEEGSTIDNVLRNLTFFLPASQIVFVEISPARRAAAMTVATTFK